MKSGFALSLVWAIVAAPNAGAVDAVDFEKQIQPILAKRCFSCHAAEKQKGGLRLDHVSSMLEGGDSGPAIVASKSGESLLIQAVTGTGDVSEMPPKGEKLSAEQINLLKLWIDQGAKASPAIAKGEPPRTKSDHWSFQPIVRHALPAIKNEQWSRNGIDRFVLARLEKEGIAPSPEADRATLIRRLSLDLLGLPPTVEEVDAFLLDNRPDAYERLVDRLLQSPHYGERWGRYWLDAARYADSDGYTIDGPRSIWKYRDWVINALNQDMPFDQFTIEQLAGDLLPGATLAQRTATGFHRNTMINGEGGTDKEQFRVEAVVDRVGTTGTVFLGLTVACAQCHSHKFDPITQKDFYQLFAFFDGADDTTLDFPTPQQMEQRKQVAAEVAQVQKELTARETMLAGMQAEWERELPSWKESWRTIDPASYLSAAGTTLTEQPDHSLLATGDNPTFDTYTLIANVDQRPITGFRLNVQTDTDLPKNGPGRSDIGEFILSEIKVEAGPLGDPTRAKPIALDGASADNSDTAHPPVHAIDGNLKTGWSVNDRAENMSESRTAHFKLAKPLAFSDGGTLRITLVHQTKAGHNLGRFRLSTTNVDDPLRLPPPPIVAAILALEPAKRTAEQQKTLSDAFKATDPLRTELVAKIATIRKKNPAVDTTMVMAERKQPRETFIHVRGDFLRHGARVYPDVPAVLPAMPQSDPSKNPNRLDLATWLVSASNPLTPRVTVNRVWQRYFGLGLVETDNDFGTQGSAPSHPELLDWLASEFIAQDWSLKRLHKLIVCSATYRQSSRSRPELATIDPRNRLLARQSRLRLDAEIIRDTALGAAGMLSKKLGGPSVFPYQPAGVMALAQVNRAWVVSPGEDRYRRTMYTYFWRSTPHPFLKLFDAPEAQVACTRRNSSNTPLQSLTLLNDQSFQEFARGLATRVLSEKAPNDTERVRRAFRLCFGREPKTIEQERIVRLLNEQLKSFAEDVPDAKAVAGPELAAGTDVVRHAAWTSVARVLLNLDEFITRE